MNFVKLFGNKIRAKDVYYKNGKNLDDTKEWQQLHVGNAGSAFVTITVDVSKYSELMLTIGTYPSNEYRILASTVFPMYAVTHMVGTDADGLFQVYYNSTYRAGFDYLGNNKIRYKSSNSGAIARLWGR